MEQDSFWTRIGNALKPKTLEAQAMEAAQDPSYKKPMNENFLKTMTPEERARYLQRFQR